MIQNWSRYLPTIPGCHSVGYRIRRTVQDLVFQAQWLDSNFYDSFQILKETIMEGYIIIVMTNDKLKEIGKRIRAEREKYGLSREKFSKLVNISPRYLSGIELGRKQMSLDTAVAVARSLHIKLDYLILGDSEPAGDAEPIIELLKKCSQHELLMASDILKIFFMKKEK